MKHWIAIALIGGLLTPSLRAADQTARDAENLALEPSMVLLQVTRQAYNYTQPWVRRTRTTPKVGIVVSENQILTTAEELFDRTLIRLQKGGRGPWVNGNLEWIDYHANLALITVPVASFWQGLKPADLAARSVVEGQIQIARWREGKIESRTAEFSQFTVDMGQLTFVPHVQLEINSEIQGIGQGEPVVSKSKILALVSGREGSRLKAIPTSFIRSILEARKNGTYKGLGYFPFVWEPSSNVDILSFLKLPGEPRGVVIIDVPKKAGTESGLKVRDIILQVDGFDIDIEGDYKDPDYGYLMLENLATRNRWAGDSIRIKVWRDGQTVDVDYKIPKADYEDSLLPDAVYDQEPEYLIVGGLLFAPLTDAYLQSWGGGWKTAAPFRLNYYNQQEAPADHPGLVLLSSVLPDTFNIGYQNLRYVVLDEVNGQKISYLSELEAALKKPINGYHDIRFAKGDSIQRIILDAGQTDAATQRVLQRYRIIKDSLILPHAKAKLPATATP